MKKIIIGVIAGLVLFAAAGAAGFFWGRASNTMVGFAPFGMMGYRDQRYAGRGGMMNNRYAYNTPRNGMMGGRGMMGFGYDGDEDGFMHDTMTAALAEKLGLSAADLQARLDKGETLTQIAESKGFTGDKFTTLMTEARTSALDQAVKDGKLTQEQADWMKQRGGWMFGGRGGFDSQDCPCVDDNS